MDVMEARTALKELAEYYFQNATVVYAKQSFRVKHEKPLVVLSFGSINRPLNPPTKIIDGQPVSFYPSTMQAQVDLYTVGRKKEIAKGMMPVMENTAENDLLLFVNFLNSPYATQFCHEKDMAIIVNNTTQDLTDLINDTNYEYRAMVELELRFTTVAVGYTGSLSPDSLKGDVVPEIIISDSGGGNSNMADDEGGYFTDVSITYMKEENRNEF